MKTWASTQNVVALSSGEAEFYAIVKGSSIGLGMRALLEDLGESVKVRVVTDATTGKSLAGRKGLGKVRHIEVSELWVQEAVKNEQIELVKIKGTFNPADLFTKHVDRATQDKIVEALGGEHMEGKHEIAQEVNTIEDVHTSDVVWSHPISLSSMIFPTSCPGA